MKKYSEEPTAMWKLTARARDILQWGIDNCTEGMDTFKKQVEGMLELDANLPPIEKGQP